MKKIKIVILIATFFAITSCKDSFLEDVPDTGIVLNENSIRTKLDLQVAVNGVYGKMLSANSFGANHFTYQELAGDNAFVSIQNSGRFVTTNGYGHLRPEDGASVGMWASIYSILANANFVLSFEGKIPENNEGTQSVNQLFAHAHAVRAYCLFTLLGYFSPNFGEDDQSLGVPMPLKYDYAAKLPRSTVSEVYNQIFIDLNYAKENFASDYTVKNTFNLNAVNLLLARTYLFRKEYTKAIEYADLVLNDASTSLLPRTNVSSFFLLSSEDNFSETLFQLQQTATNNLLLESISGTWSSSGTYKQNFMVRDFWNKFPATDVRKTGFYNGTNNFVMNLPDDPKPVDVRKYTSSARDIIQFRKSEAIFIKAEAMYHTNPSAAATNLEAWVKTYRNTSYVIPANNGEALLNEILNQKAFELFLEGHRFFDLKRNHLPIVKKLSSTNTLTIAANDYRFIWPIPLSEMQTNPNITQAPGY